MKEKKRSVEEPRLFRIQPTKKYQQAKVTIDGYRCTAEDVVVLAVGMALLTELALGEFTLLKDYLQKCLREPLAHQPEVLASMITGIGKLEEEIQAGLPPWPILRLKLDEAGLLPFLLTGRLLGDPEQVKQAKEAIARTPNPFE